jgi:type IV pilus assembly protein PilA
MIVVAIIGILAAIAIPNFLNFRLKAKTAEAKTNLGSIRSTEMAYFAEWNFYVVNQTQTPINGRAWNNEKVPWDDNTRFSLIGFAAERAVYYSYTLEPIGGAVFVPRATGMTITAVGDLDADGDVTTFWINDVWIEVAKRGTGF